MISISPSSRRKAGCIKSVRCWPNDEQCRPTRTAPMCNAAAAVASPPLSCSRSPCTFEDVCMAPFNQPRVPRRVRLQGGQGQWHHQHRLQGQGLRRGRDPEEGPGRRPASPAAKVGMSETTRTAYGGPEQADGSDLQQFIAILLNSVSPIELGTSQRHARHRIDDHPRRQWAQ